MNCRGKMKPRSKSACFNHDRLVAVCLVKSMNAVFQYDASCAGGKRYGS